MAASNLVIFCGVTLMTSAEGTHQFSAPELGPSWKVERFARGGAVPKKLGTFEAVGSLVLDFLTASASMATIQARIAAARNSYGTLSVAGEPNTYPRCLLIMEGARGPQQAIGTPAGTDGQFMHYAFSVLRFP